MKKRGIRTLALVLALTALCGCSHRSAAGRDPADGAESSGAASIIEEEPKPEYIVYPAFTDRTFTAKNHMLTMSNSKRNQVDFVFVVEDHEGNELFTSDPVAPGEKVQWDVTNRWHGRSHTIQITTIPILEDGQEGNSSSQKIVITINL